MTTIVKHIAFVLDGNGRWAKNKNLPLTDGHRKGLENLEKILDFCFHKGIKIVTLYAFSSENWKRSQQEKSILFDLLAYYFENKLHKIIKNNTKVKVIGNVKLFPEKIQETIFKTELASKENDQFLLQIALSYGGRDEIIRGIRRLFQAIENQEASIDELNENEFKAYLDTGKIPDPDLLIRTGGELRLSNFLLYQQAYTEFYFTSTLWPDFSPEELEEALECFSLRERRFGGRHEK